MHRIKGLSKSNAFNFVLILGIVNLFSDITYEGASSINGPFLKSLGASALAIGIITGVGEFLGYSLRYISGYISDKTNKYWLITFVGYFVNLLAVPAMALVGNWPLAASLIIAERVGRAIRKPTIETMLSYTANQFGRGWVYAVNTALDQLGATIGPLLMSLVLFLQGDFATGYALLLISALLALATLTIARYYFPNPTSLEIKPIAKLKGFTASYWLYMIAGSFIAAGLMSYEFISFHFTNSGSVTGHWIPLFFSIAMGTDAISSLVFGKLFDRHGIPVVLVAVFLSGLFAPFIFLGNFWMALIGIILWGIGFGAQDTLLKAIIAGVLPEGKRNQAFGLFYVGYGAGWLFGSTFAGFLYGHSLYLLVLFSMAIQFLSLPLFIVAKMKELEE